MQPDQGDTCVLFLKMIDLRVAWRRDMQSVLHLACDSFWTVYVSAIFAPFSGLFFDVDSQLENRDSKTLREGGVKVNMQMDTNF
jgi:hypothetical protein